MVLDIRNAAFADVEAVATIHVESWRAAYAGIFPERFLKDLSVQKRSIYWQQALRDGKPQLLVACEGPAVVGWIAFGPCRDSDKDGNWAEIEAVYVAPDAWGTGVGRRLTHSASDLLLGAGYSFLALWVLEQNFRARAFYERNGFNADDPSKKQIQIGGVSLTELRYHCALPGIETVSYPVIR
ncbi:GNAT family N-acetyltransferase [Robbsia sp. Bb-Pol-6]|uniref:GNAT family N-acetyltransferase n=1 Tax=Robbsia betulipollinis TaxID=2981849 RepID=A0ABT3ZTJ8_9BURK|nr:GNAT family N-acetyltransferase [Robbsia betulipollinis]MCY0389858.1 GNAT family N-acetyltransferase [Robbsia betulipollinis]